MATTYRIKRKLFANVAAVTSNATKLGAGWTQQRSLFGLGNFGNAASGTKTMINKDLLAQGNAAMANAKTDAAKEAAQKMIDSSKTTVALTKGERRWEAAKGVAKTAPIAVVGGGLALGASDGK